MIKISAASVYALVSVKCFRVGSRRRQLSEEAEHLEYISPIIIEKDHPRELIY